MHSVPRLRPESRLPQDPSTGGSCVTLSSQSLLCQACHSSTITSESEEGVCGREQCARQREQREPSSVPFSGVRRKACVQACAQQSSWVLSPGGGLWAPVEAVGVNGIAGKAMLSVGDPLGDMLGLALFRVRATGQGFCGPCGWNHW